jgi:hypothetical protein
LAAISVAITDDIVGGLGNSFGGDLKIVAGLSCSQGGGFEIEMGLRVLVFGLSNTNTFTLLGSVA